jgi:hypothetical protein
VVADTVRSADIAGAVVFRPSLRVERELVVAQVAAAPTAANCDRFARAASTFRTLSAIDAARARQLRAAIVNGEHQPLASDAVDRGSPTRGMREPIHVRVPRWTW